MVNFITNSLKKDGLDVIKINETILYISWDKSNINNTKINVNNNEHRPIEDYKPIGNILYDDKSMSSISDKSFKFLSI